MCETNKDITRRDLIHGLDWYKVFGDEVNSVDKQLFELKLGILGFIALIFSIIFSNADNLQFFSKSFKYHMLIIMVLVILLFVEEILIKIKKQTSNFSKQSRRVVLLNIRDHAAYEFDKFKAYGIRAEEILEKENEIRSEMVLNKSIEEIIIKNSPKNTYFLHIFNWVALPVLIIILLFIEIYFH